nr:MAG TPA: hypothetical protein [Caudoviricetes sp.]
MENRAIVRERTHRSRYPILLFDKYQSAEKYKIK